MSRADAPHREPASVASEDHESPTAWQFSLRGAFLATTAAAGAAALAGYRGLGSLVLSLGLAAAWLNVRGRLAPLQTRYARPRLFYAGWLLLVGSLFLPAMKGGCNNSTLRGWETAQACLLLEAGAVTEAIENPAAVFKQSSEQLREGARIWTILTLINAANLLLLLSPLLLWRLQRGKGEWLGAAFAIGAISPWAVPLGDGPLVGCYVWCASFLVLLISYRIQAPTFYAMLGLAAVYVLL